MILNILFVCLGHDEFIKRLEDEILGINDRLCDIDVKLETEVYRTKTRASSHDRITHSCTYEANEILPALSPLVKPSATPDSRALSAICACQSLLHLIESSPTCIQ